MLCALRQNKEAQKAFRRRQKVGSLRCCACQTLFPVLCALPVRDSDFLRATTNGRTLEQDSYKDVQQCDVCTPLQAKQAETETRVAELAAQLEQLQQENQSLYRRNLTLQSALVVRSAEPALPTAPRGSVESAVSTSGQV